MSPSVITSAICRLSRRSLVSSLPLQCTRCASTINARLSASSPSVEQYTSHKLSRSTPSTRQTHTLGRRDAFRPITTSIRASRCFFSTTSRRAAKVVTNPRVDEEGNALMIEISSRAAERLRDITDPSSSPSAIKEENPYHHLRITVTSGGCHGFQYLMSLESASKIDPDEDTVFEAEPPTVAAAADGKGGQALVVMDEPSLELLSGSTVDYTMELIGSQFKIVDNPRATSNCGCGTSFDVND